MTMSWRDRYDVAKSTFEGDNPNDGTHAHLLRLADGSVVQTEPDSGHRHAKAHGADRPHDGAHTHILKLSDGSLVETNVDGVHRHGSRGATDGIHSHLVTMPNGTLLETQIDGPHWHDYYYEEDGMAKKVAKQLPPEVGPDITDQSGWRTEFVATPPRLPATNSLHFDTEETVAKARKVVADLKSRA